MTAVTSDPNYQNFKSKASKHGPHLPRHIASYFLSKIPIIEWIPHYSPQWLFNDILAGMFNNFQISLLADEIGTNIAEVLPSEFFSCHRVYLTQQWRIFRPNMG